MSGIFRKASVRRSTSESANGDTNSLFSVASKSSNTIPRRFLPRSLSRQSSVVSLQTEASGAHYDTMSISSHHQGPSRQPLSIDPNATPVPGLSRSSTRSMKRLAKTPPSSFHARSAVAEPARDISAGIDNPFDDENLQSAKDIRREIELVEAEGRRLMDAFNGLELTALTRRQPRPGHLTPTTSASHLSAFSDRDSTWTQVPDRRSIRNVGDSDAVSVRSTGSNGTSLSATRSPYRAWPASASQSVSLGRKSSMSSISSRARHPVSPAPPVPPIPSSLGRLGVGSTSSVNLARSATHLPLPPVAEGDGRESLDGTRPTGSTYGRPMTMLFPSTADDTEIAAMEAEMTDIRRRRTEVVGRYEERLEYLRAKLKGAELHEKLMRR